jgi:hypothetical protein
LDANFVNDFGFSWDHPLNPPPGSRIIDGMIVPRGGIVGVPFPVYRPEEHMICGILIQNYWRVDAFGSSLLNRAMAADHQTYRVPDWLLMILGLLPLIPTVRLWYRTIARPEGLCVACGYDLRATPQRCPECGLATFAPT